MLKCNGMWNMEWEFPIPILIPDFCNVECGIVLLRISHSDHAKVHWNVEYGMGIPHSIFHIPEFESAECGIVLLRISHSNHAKVHCNVEYGMGIPHSNSYS